MDTDASHCTPCFCQGAELSRRCLHVSGLESCIQSRRLAVGSAYYGSLSFTNDDLWSVDLHVPCQLNDAGVEIDSQALDTLFRLWVSKSFFVEVRGVHIFVFEWSQAERKRQLVFRELVA